MRFERITAHAFGPFSGETLEFVPGMNVVFGPNEAGKSSWHAALYAGLCGMRRGKGPPSRHEQEFAERHKPWEGTSWRVAATIVLQDRRRVELDHNLNTRVGRALDADRGNDWSSELMAGDGTVDGSRWLGLDRQAFLATACVRQADILTVRKDAKALQKHLQRAASSSAGDETVAGALDRIAAFKQKHVGSDQINAVGPLRQATRRREETEEAVRKAGEAHAQYLNLIAQLEDIEAKAQEAEGSVAAAEAYIAGQAAEEFARRVDRARELAARFPDGPPGGVVRDDDLAQEVTRALKAWEGRPPVPELTGRPANELQAEIAKLPQPPEGDLEVHTGVETAHGALRRAEMALDLHARRRPSAPSFPETRGASEQELRDLARDLGRPEPSVDPALEAQLQEAETRQGASAGPTDRTAALLGAALLTAAGVVLWAQGLNLLGVLLLVAGLALGTWTLSRSGDGARAKALQKVLEARSALAQQQAARFQVLEQKEAARARLTALHLEPDAASLLKLADSLVTTQRAQRDLEQWQGEQDRLQIVFCDAGSALALALASRGVEVDSISDATAAYSAYATACAERRGVADQAKRRPALEAQLALRGAAEDAARDALGRRAAAEREVRDAAARCDVAGLDDDALGVGLREWESRRREELKKLDQDKDDWAELQALLQGRTVGELETEAERRQETAREKATAINPAALASFVPEPAIGPQLERLGLGWRETARQRDELAGEVKSWAQGQLSVAEAEEAGASAQQELDRVRRLEGTLRTTQEFLQAAQVRVHRDMAPVLRGLVQERLASVTRDRYIEVRVDPADLNVTVREASSGTWRAAELLSHGTAEQIYLLLRVALAERLVQQGEVCPLILDDVTTQSDRLRTRAILETLHALSRERQIILFTQEDEVLDWAAAALTGDKDHVIRLGSL